jgi:hypothetical protein
MISRNFPLAVIEAKAAYKKPAMDYSRQKNMLRFSVLNSHTQQMVMA